MKEYHKNLGKYTPDNQIRIKNGWRYEIVKIIPAQTDKTFFISFIKFFGFLRWWGVMVEAQIIWMKIEIGVAKDNFQREIF